MKITRDKVVVLLFLILSNVAIVYLIINNYLGIVTIIFGVMLPMNGIYLGVLINRTILSFFAFILFVVVMNVYAFSHQKYGALVFDIFPMIFIYFYLVSLLKKRKEKM